MHVSGTACHGDRDCITTQGGGPKKGAVRNLTKGYILIYGLRDVLPIRIGFNSENALYIGMIFNKDYLVLELDSTTKQS